MDSQAILAGVQESQRVRTEIEAERQRRQDDEEKRRRREVYSWLAAADSAEDQETATETRSKYPTTGSWIFRELLVKTWCDPSSQSEPCLWINGKPGAGKLSESLWVAKAEWGLIIRENHSCFRYHREMRHQPGHRRSLFLLQGRRLQ